MNSTVNPSLSPSFVLPHGTPAAARTVLNLLQRLSVGSLAVQMPDGRTQTRFVRVCRDASGKYAVVD